ncbi:MAG: gliding motility-associated protein GldE [Muribaculaceae bacterium]|nr:gliding motility-associated protein GldE [Muribaculaceae bacterium]
MLSLILASAGIEQSIISFNAPTTASIIAGLVAICSLCVSAFVSASEIAYFSLKDTDFEKFESQRTLDMVKKLLANPEKLLATILISNNLVNVTIIILCNFVMNQVLEVRSSVLDFIIQSVFLTFLILLFGEIIPKIYSSNNNIRFASFAANGLTFLSKLFNPISRIMVKSTIIVNKVVTKRADDISMDDLSQALELSEVNSENEKELLEGILTFGDKTVAEIMRPRVDVVDIDFKADFDEVVKIVVENGYSRMPVYEDNNDNIKGVLYAKDLLPYIGKRSKDFNWTTLLRQAYFVPETREIGDLLEDFRKTKVHMAIIVDEFGCTQGIVTLEDILEEIVGDINDEYDTDEDNSYKKINDNTYIFEGKTLINDFYKITDIEEDAFEEIEDDAETIAGLILNLKGDFPKEKDTIEYGRFQFQVLKVSKHRIVSVKVKIN